MVPSNSEYAAKRNEAQADTETCMSLTPTEPVGQPAVENAATAAALEPLRLHREENLPDFLPGRLQLRAGDAADYDQLARFHYRQRRPATWAGVICFTWTGDGRAERVVGVGVLSWPTAVNRARREVFGLDRRDYAGQIRFANRYLRTISRVIVHPQFRGLGLARLLVEALCRRCPTRFVETTAAMAAAHPMFRRARMNFHDAPGGKPYFWLDREPGVPFPSPLVRRGGRGSAPPAEG